MKSTFTVLLFTLSIFIFSCVNTNAQDADTSNSSRDLLYSKKVITGKELKLFFESFVNIETIDAFNGFRCLNSEGYPKVDISGISIGMFTCGTEDIEYVSGRLAVKVDLHKESITQAIAKYEADFDSLKIASGYDRYFPVTLFLQGKSQYPFRRVNVDAVTWLSNNIIPSPSIEVKGVKAQMIYDTSLRNFFRSMAFYYDYLHNELDLDYELMLYKEMIAEEDSNMAGNWLQFWYNRKDYGSEVNPEVKSHQFMGFWLRRELDGSADALHLALLKILNTYDHNWVEEKSQAEVESEVDAEF
jgi:hypothetical protein